MIYSQLLLSRDELKRKYGIVPMGTGEVVPDVVPSKVSDGAKATAMCLFDVLDDLEKAHESLEPRRKNDAEQGAK